LTHLRLLWLLTTERHPGRLLQHLEASKLWLLSRRHLLLLLDHLGTELVLQLWVCRKLVLFFWHFLIVEILRLEFLRRRPHKLHRRSLSELIFGLKFRFVLFLLCLRDLRDPLLISVCKGVRGASECLALIDVAHLVELGGKLI